MDRNIIGSVNSVQTLGTLDGPGVRFVVFMQGCPLRCACCHNPETWDVNGTAQKMTPEELLKKVSNYKEYFGTVGGVTVSGGEPLLQTPFIIEFFKKCKEAGINTCLDTSGCIIDENTARLLKYTDYCLLDIKYMSDKKYRKYVGCSIKKPLEFLRLLNTFSIESRIRYVVIEGINDSEAEIKELNKLASSIECVKQIELLPFKNICSSKYKELGIPFKFAEIPQTSQSKTEHLKSFLSK